MFTITYAFFVKSPLGASSGPILSGAPKARSDPCPFAAVLWP